jgi:hypothetical protein
MIDAADVLRRLLSAPTITRAALATVPTEQGRLLLWLAEEPRACLKVGIAGPRQGRAYAARLRNHFGSFQAVAVQTETRQELEEVEAAVRPQQELTPSVCIVALRLTGMGVSCSRGLLGES